MIHPPSTQGPGCSRIVAGFMVNPERPEAGSFAGCHPDDATQWAVYRKTPYSTGPNDYDQLIRTLPTREQANALAYHLAEKGRAGQ